jgi:two-component system OmpR family response regulator
MNGPAKVLIIDDDPTILDATGQILQAAGLRVALHDGRFGRLSRILTEQPDLVLLDVNMPVLSGEELHEMLRGTPELARIPVVFFSSNDERSLRRLAARTGAHGYLPKSELGRDFAARVKELIESARPAA